MAQITNPGTEQMIRLAAFLSDKSNRMSVTVHFGCASCGSVMEVPRGVSIHVAPDFNIRWGFRNEVLVKAPRYVVEGVPEPMQCFQVNLWCRQFRLQAFISDPRTLNALIALWEELFGVNPWTTSSAS